MGDVMKVAFIGLGNMGLPMAINLVRAGEQVYGYDLSPAALRELALAGGIPCDSARQAVDGAEAVISMLPASRHVHSLYCHPDGVLNFVARGSILIDCSTISPATSRQASKIAEECGLDMIDAPVSGGTQSAQAGTLTFMIGSTIEQLARAQPLLEKMGKRVVHAGSSGAGQTAKLCNNMLLGILMLANSEAIQLGIANGLDPKTLCDITNNSSGANCALKTNNPCPGVDPMAASSRDYTGGFAVDLMLKDLGLAIETSLQSGTSAALGSLARNLFALHSAAGNGERDFGSVFDLYGRRLA
jgi:3-hydroxyisobutyrate dehydrogenase